jgi:hypothetical protein
MLQEIIITGHRKYRQCHKTIQIKDLNEFAHFLFFLILKERKECIILLSLALRIPKIYYKRLIQLPINLLFWLSTVGSNSNLINKISLLKKFFSPPILME